MMRAELRIRSQTALDEPPSFVTTAVFSKEGLSPEVFNNADALRGLGFQPRPLGTAIVIIFVWDFGQGLPSIFVQVSGRRTSDEPVYELYQVVEATEAEIFGIVRAFMPNIGELVERARIDAVKAVERFEGFERFEVGLRDASRSNPDAD
ncbi:MAG: hypothetical protein V1716_02505 [Candidatus Uhrbacteria bacterium]